MKQQLFWVPGTFIYPGKVHFAAGVWRRPLISRRSTVQGLKRKDIKHLFSSFSYSFTFLLTLNDPQNCQTSLNYDGLALIKSFFFFFAHLLSVHSHSETASVAAILFPSEHVDVSDEALL